MLGGPPSLDTRTPARYATVPTFLLTKQWNIETYIFFYIVGGCEYDYVEIFDGPTAHFPSLGKFCGETLPAVKPSSKNKILIRFVSDTTVNKRGFRIKYYAKGKIYLRVNVVLNHIYIYIYTHHCPRAL